MYISQDHGRGMLTTVNNMLTLIIHLYFIYIPTVNTDLLCMLVFSKIQSRSSHKHITTLHLKGSLIR